METQLLLGDCLEQLKNIKDNTIDSIVTDPPYGLSFMGKKWDYDVPSTQIWEECIRVLKPGGHLLSFAGSRTYHRMAVRIEDAGFEIRDQIMWIYGSGFPKSHNIGKAVDKIEGNDREVVGLHERQNLKKGGAGFRQLGSDELRTDYYVDKGNSDWEGWGTALKPAHEPIVMARKPLVGTVANNVLEWGVGGINIDGCRIGTTKEDLLAIKKKNDSFDNSNNKEYNGIHFTSINRNMEVNTEGRFPANIILDEEAGKILDEQSGTTKSSKRGAHNNKPTEHTNTYTPTNAVYSDDNTYGDSGGASRFFYCPKASKKDRDENNIHPTVKPTDLMGYLIRLVTPKGGVVLDPFTGSGSTGKAAVREGMQFIGIEREEEYFHIAKQRIEWEVSKKPNNKFW